MILSGLRNPATAPQFGAVKLVHSGGNQYEVQLTDADMNSQEAKDLFAQTDGDMSRINFRVQHGNQEGGYGRYSRIAFQDPHFTLMTRCKDPGDGVEGVHSAKRVGAPFRLVQKAKETAPKKAFEDFMGGFKSWLGYTIWKNSYYKTSADQALQAAQARAEAANQSFDNTKALEQAFKATSIQA